jgi:hypothetical protein
MPRDEHDAEQSKANELHMQLASFGLHLTIFAELNLTIHVAMSKEKGHLAPPRYPVTLKCAFLPKLSHF